MPIAGDGSSANGPEMAQTGWEHFEHEADIGLRVTAPSRAAVFELMGEALTAVVTEPASVRSEEERVIDCEAPDDSLLLVDWLNGLIYAMATEHLLFSSWRVQLDGQRLHGRARGEFVDRRRHQPAVEVKGATYTALEMQQGPDGMWRAQCVVDV